MAFCDSPAVGVLENHPNKSDSKAHRASPELGVSLGQVTEKKQNKQRGETAHHRGNPQGMGAGTFGVYFLWSLPQSQSRTQPSHAF